MRKAAFFIDGFNLYHSLDTKKEFRKYKWLNLWELARLILLPNEELADVYYFTAYADWNPDRKKRHQMYVLMNESVGCKVILGKFLKKDRVSMVKCHRPCQGGSDEFCKKKFTAHEEKMTDVNIAVSIVKAAAKRMYDSIYLLSGDNDLRPALETAREIYPSLRIRVVLPIDAQAKTLMDFCMEHSFKYIRIKQKVLSDAQFSDPFFVGNTPYHKPERWN